MGRLINASKYALRYANIFVTRMYHLCPLLVLLSLSSILSANLLRNNGIRHPSKNPAPIRPRTRNDAYIPPLNGLIWISGYSLLYRKGCLAEQRRKSETRWWADKYRWAQDIPMQPFPTIVFGSLTLPLSINTVTNVHPIRTKIWTIYGHRHHPCTQLNQSG